MTPPRIVLVDPDFDARRILHAIFAHEWWDVREASELEEGLQIAIEFQPDVIVTELFPGPPRGSPGVELFVRDVRTASIPLVILTAHALPESRQRSLGEMPVLLLRKPLAPLEVVAMASGVLEHPRSPVTND
ncbi:MAG: hypothetical protein WD766_01195 [Gemmatimonadota bacterium]